MDEEDEENEGDKEDMCLRPNFELSAGRETCGIAGSKEQAQRKIGDHPIESHQLNMA